MPVQKATPRTRAQQLILARDKVRLHNPATGELLHLSGQGTTKSVTWSWLGQRDQADTLRSRAEANGEDWPFVPVHRDQMDQTQGGNDG